jgi:serine/threonine protein kinase
MAKWKRIRKIASAGQAEIFLVENAATGERAVMKKLHAAPQLEDPGAELRRFQREVRSQRIMDHPGIMPILGANFETSPPWYVMPEATRSLQQHLDDYAEGLDQAEAVKIVLTVMDAVSYAHGEGIYHRDLKPANILELDGKWVVGDFGLCRDLNSDSTTFTQSSRVVGTIAYMAPEQYDDAHAIDETADVFALGRILFHLLTGSVPFPYMRIGHAPAEFRFLLTKAVAEEPGDRYASVDEFRRQIELIVGESDDLTPTVERAKKLLTSILKSEIGSAQPLLELILASAHDEEFNAEFVAELPEPVLASLQAANEPAFGQMIRTFDELSKGGHPFSYVDVIADFFARVFRVATDQGIRRIALHRIMIVGEAHTRFYVGDVFSRLVTGLKDPHEILLAVDVMRAEPEVARWYSSYLKSSGGSLAPVILSVLDEAK